MSANGVVTKNQVVDAATAAVARLTGGELNGFRLAVLGEEVHASSGGWIIPVVVEGAAPGLTGHQLSRALSQIQDEVGVGLHVDATVVLEP